MSAVFLNEVGIVSALGQGIDTTREQLFADRPGGVAPTDAYTPGRPLHLGRVPGALPASCGLPMRFRSRNNTLVAAALAQIRPQVDAAVQRWGPARVAVVLGVSTAGLDEGIAALRARAAGLGWPAGYDYAQQEMGSAAAWIAHELQTHGPAHVISTACSSGAKALASAARLLRGGRVDAVLAGGADALSGFTIAGFSALESVAAGRCNPMSANRCGINLGEGAALFLMSREPGPVRLAGWGETSDAHHMSAPDPGGRGAMSAMRLAMDRAGLDAGAIDYLNLHGTATRQNDAMESLAVARAVGLRTPVGSTKPLTGHALAAAGAIEAALAWCCLVGNPAGRLPPHWWDGAADPGMPALRLVAPGESAGRPLRHILSNSFAFGGSNASLLFARA
jgi:3-oxoacyl-[acyl-carrier-protein] synthase-1